MLFSPCFALVVGVGRCLVQRAPFGWPSFLVFLVGVVLGAIVSAVPKLAADVARQLAEFIVSRFKGENLARH